MTLKECVEIAAVLLQLEDVETELAKPTIDYSSEAGKTIKLLTRCGNIAINEISLDYVPLVKTERILSNNKQLRFDKFERKIIDILSVKKNGETVKYRAYSTGLDLDVDGELDVEYSYAPLEAVLTGVIEFATYEPTKETIAYAIAREYCLVSGLLQEATIFDSRFLSLVNHVSPAKKERKIRERQWFF